MQCGRLFPDKSNELKCILLPHYSLHHAFLLLRPGVANYGHVPNWNPVCFVTTGQSGHVNYSLSMAANELQ